MLGNGRVFRANGRLVNISEFFVQTMHKLPPSFSNVTRRKFTVARNYVIINLVRVLETLEKTGELVHCLTEKNSVMLGNPSNNNTQEGFSESL